MLSVVCDGVMSVCWCVCSVLTVMGEANGCVGVMREVLFSLPAVSALVVLM